MIFKFHLLNPMIPKSLPIVEIDLKRFLKSYPNFQYRLLRITLVHGQEKVVLSLDIRSLHNVDLDSFLYVFDETLARMIREITHKYYYDDED